MKYCIKCGNQIPKDADYCAVCGAYQKAFDKQSVPAMGNELVQAKKCDLKSVLIVVLALACTVLAVAGILIYKNAKNETVLFSESPEAISRAASSVIKLSCYNKEGELYCTGSGFALFEPDTFVTNYHVIQDDVYSIIGENDAGISFPLTSVIIYDTKFDIAILKSNTDTGIPVLAEGDSDNITKGSKVIAIGSPLGLTNSISQGVYSNIVESGRMDYLEFSAAISQGSSGGALFNDAGEVVGVTSASYVEGQNLNLAVPISKVRFLWERNHHEMPIEDFYNLFSHAKSYPVSELLDNRNEHYLEEVIASGVINILDGKAYLFASKESLADFDNYSYGWRKFSSIITLDQYQLDYLKMNAIELDVPGNALQGFATGDIVAVKGCFYGNSLINIESIDSDE